MSKRNIQPFKKNNLILIMFDLKTGISTNSNMQSGALPGKMLLVRIIEIIILMLILGQTGLNKG